jgi:predicted DCC family thiol-disulfide oxidoreductase YuxK
MKTQDKPIVFFDGKCNLCNRSVDRIVKWDRNKKIYISSLQGETAKSMLSPEVRENLDSVVLYSNKKTYTKSTAAIKIISNLKWYLRPFSILLLVPKFVRDSLYEFVSKNRYKWFGQNETCRMPTDDEKSYFLP